MFEDSAVVTFVAEPDWKEGTTVSPTRRIDEFKGEE